MLFRNLGQGTFSVPPIQLVTSSDGGLFSTSAFGDFSGVGEMDLVVGTQLGSNSVAIHRNYRQTTRFADGRPVFTATGGKVDVVLAGHLSSPNHTDLVVVTHSRLVVLQQLPRVQGGALRFHSTVFDVFPGNREVALCDITGSGTLDIVYIANTAALRWFRNDGLDPSGRIVWTHMPSVVSLPDIFVVSCGDVVGDEMVDVVIASGLVAAQVTVLENVHLSNRSSFFRMHSLTPIDGGTFLSLSFADFNHDGKDRSSMRRE